VLRYRDVQIDTLIVAIVDIPVRGKVTIFSCYLSYTWWKASLSYSKEELHVQKLLQLKTVDLFSVELRTLAVHVVITPVCLS